MTPDSSALSLRSLVDAHPSLRPTPTPPKEIIAVCGGVRGLQGSSVVKFLLRDNIFQARALTRDVESPKAIELVKLGVQVVYADFDKPETLKVAFEGVYGVFGMTNFFEHADGPREIRQGKNLVDAAREAGVKHFVWSTCEECPAVVSIGTKAVVQDYLEKSGVPYTNVFFVFYYENFLAFAMKKLPDGNYDMVWPYPTDEPLPCLTPEDAGGWVTAAFLDPETWIGQDLKVCSERVTLREFGKLWTEVSGKSVAIHDKTKEEFYEQREVFEDLDSWEMMHWLLTVARRERDLDLARRLHGDMQSLRSWMEEYHQVPKQLPQLTYEVNFEIISDTGSSRSS
ncbi:NAD(P)-binding protein [Exidia glandulosa HHB12029]|uniref:NAD(P)-binding protein n=1 Tax=Exidia glandulosa HHB12029 TaxID=1314781 RepID=A0A165D6A9_EXIGL|nr:NAD(P)-binding protein [Exidia glandulosa HHB12029]